MKKTGKRPFNSKKLLTQNWNANMKEWDRHRKRDLHKELQRTILALKVISIVACGWMLRSLLFTSGIVDRIVHFGFFAIVALGIFTAVMYLSGQAAPESFWGRIDQRRRRLAWNDHRFRMKSIVSAELWLAYIFVSFVMLRVALSSHEPLRIGAALFLLLSATCMMCFLMITFVKPRKFRRWLK
jgi:TRAP-type uncharacterized transport system fused permease subunit